MHRLVVGDYRLVVRGYRLVVGGWWLVAMAALAGPVTAQTPQPFPRAGQQTQAPRQPAPAAPQAPPPVTQAPPPARPSQPAASAAAPPPPVSTDTPTAAALGVPIYPGAQFMASYDAGRGQRYFLFGATAPFIEIVQFYRTQLKDGGDTVFREPPTHMFNVGRFRSETMAFPPGVTVKDWTWGGSQGYPNPKLGGQPARFASVIMIVPAPRQ